MKTSIFDMNFTLPPMAEMTEVEKGYANGNFLEENTCPVCRGILTARRTHENIYI